jgi:hypothetical protein
LAGKTAISNIIIPQATIERIEGISNNKANTITITPLTKTSSL